MRKKPVEQHILQGTYRQDRHGKCGLTIEIPKCPKGMAPRARTHWRRLAKLLNQAGIISHIDGLSLRLLAESIDLYLTATEKLAAHGLIAKTTNGNIIQSPFLPIRNRAWEQIVKLAGQFGLTPADRTGMTFKVGYPSTGQQRGCPDKSLFFPDQPRSWKPK
jgi:P27 family predicted phage terminase small subunit